jgi:ribosomal protein S12 methylthiotransferase accessory factor
MRAGTCCDWTTPNIASTRIPECDIDIQVPPDFRQEYHDALIRAADQCAVKKHLEHPPVFEVKTVVT